MVHHAAPIILRMSISLAVLSFRAQRFASFPLIFFPLVSGQHLKVVRCLRNHNHNHNHPHSHPHPHNHFSRLSPLNHLCARESWTLLSMIPLLTSNVAISNHPFRGKMDYCCTIIAFTFLKTTSFVWNFYNNTTIHYSQAITALPKPLNCCRAITGIPACMLISSLMSPPANYALGASRRVTSNMAS